MFWFWCLDAYPIFLRKLHLLFCGSQCRGVETITFSSTQHCQRDRFPLSYQNNLCSLFTVHKKYLTLLYHNLSPEKVYKSFKIFSFINICTWDTHIKWAQVYLVTTTLMLQSLTPYRWHQRSGSCVTEQQHSRESNADVPGPADEHWPHAGMLSAPKTSPSCFWVWSDRPMDGQEECRIPAACWAQATQHSLLFNMLLLMGTACPINPDTVLCWTTTKKKKSIATALRAFALIPSVLSALVPLGANRHRSPFIKPLPQSPKPDSKPQSTFFFLRPQLSIFSCEEELWNFPMELFLYKCLPFLTCDRNTISLLTKGLSHYSVPHELIHHYLWILEVLESSLITASTGGVML